ncbi:MAG: alpha/beta fold hydrolase [Chloroflexi bacterium]|nr:alpha/beta fold hydrolase [Chloroflexota bacterium]
MPPEPERIEMPRVHGDGATTPARASLSLASSARRWTQGIVPDGHIETLAGALRPLDGPAASARRVIVEVAPDNAVETWWTAPERAVRGSALLVHGLGGSAHRPHVLGLAAEAVRRGWHAVRVNLRNHGGTAHLGDTLFSAVQSGDLEAVLRAMEEAHLPRPYALIGVSLGGAMALRYAALAGEGSRADAVVALNPALDFFVVERAINRPANLVYLGNFVHALCRMVDQVRALRPVAGPSASPLRLRTIRRFDHHFTVPAAGYDSVDDYYRAASPRPLLDQLRVPTLMLTAADDPIVPAPMIAAHHRAAAGRVRALIADRGGHVGYRVTDEDRRQRFWAATPVFDYLEDEVTPHR